MKTLKAFTLIEVLVCCFILSVVMAGVFSVFSVGDACWTIDSAMLDLQQQARLAMDGMSREIRQADPSSVSITEGGKKINFSVGTYPISYYPQGKKIIREHAVLGGTTRILAADIKTLDFSFSNPVVVIRIEAEKKVRGRDISFPLLQKVRLRNE